MTTDTPPALPLMHELSAIKNYLIAAQQVLQSGQMPDMGGLEERISTLCKSIEQSPKEARHLYLPEMNALLGQLDACEKNLKEWRKHNS